MRKGATGARLCPYQNCVICKEAAVLTVKILESELQTAGNSFGKSLSMRAGCAPGAYEPVAMKKTGDR